MSDKKRTTVTTIETHEVWVLRKAVPGVVDEAEMHPPIEISQSVAVSNLSEVDDTSQTSRTTHD
jgi:hypothetical protein